jgi:hypothetical protein
MTELENGTSRKRNEQEEARAIASEEKEDYAPIFATEGNPLRWYGVLEGVDDPSPLYRVIHRFSRLGDNV